ncbi:uncharacterized protein HKW66_Vig0106550 [Vigna angularis]|uniref:Uncharacterized protein n=1 Tax=Phaseolus angularis TaxID=3914 RepID=A0A8T0L183_PHAAN|nr:uncharacterized protein HKW66_Vig0106550 [Vigna angularis]
MMLDKYGASAGIEAKSEHRLCRLSGLEQLVKREIQVALVRIELGNVVYSIEQFTDIPDLVKFKVQYTLEVAHFVYVLVEITKTQFDESLLLVVDFRTTLSLPRIHACTQKVSL